MPTIQKMIPLANGGRTGLKLDGPTWQAIEWLANRSGQTWQSWCASIIEGTAADENVTAVVRETAMRELISGTIDAPRATLDSVAERHPLLRYSAILSDQELDDFKRLGDVWGTEDFGGFKIHAGTDEADQPCLWIENGLKEWPSIMLVLSQDSSQD